MIELVFRAPVTETPTMRRFFDDCLVARDSEGLLQLLPRSEVAGIERFRQLEILTPGKHQLMYPRRLIVEGSCGGWANFKRDGTNALGEQFPYKFLGGALGDLPMANAAVLQLFATGGRCRGAGCHNGAGLAYRRMRKREARSAAEKDDFGRTLFPEHFPPPSARGVAGRMPEVRLAAEDGPAGQDNVGPCAGDLQTELVGRAGRRLWRDTHHPETAVRAARNRDDLQGSCGTLQRIVPDL